MKAFVFALTLILNTIQCLPLYSQVDSTAVYPVHKWRLDLMIYEIEKGRECGKVIKFQEVEIQKGLAVEVRLRNEKEALNNAIVSQNTELALAKSEVSTTKEMLANQEEMTKHERKQKNKWKLATVGSLGLFVLVLL